VGGRPHARELLRRGCVTEEEGRCPEKEARDRESAHDRPDPGATLRYYSKISHPEITGRIGYSEASSGPRRSEFEGRGCSTSSPAPAGNPNGASRIPKEQGAFRVAHGTLPSYCINAADTHLFRCTSLHRGESCGEVQEVNRLVGEIHTFFLRQLQDAADRRGGGGPADRGDPLLLRRREQPGCDPAAGDGDRPVRAATRRRGRDG